jgi:hydroxymethylglutaryl-CoA lyase
MSERYPEIIYTEEGMREGMQIESADIPVDAKVALLDALSETGLKRIVVGSFVSPRYTPQMARIDELMEKFHPKEGVTYTALALNPKGVERAREYSPPLTIERGSGRPALRVHMCDVFARRNTNRSQMQEMAQWPQVIAKAKEDGATEAAIGTNATFGSNFVGDFTVDMTMKFLEMQHELWDAAGIKVTQATVGDPMGWCHPLKVEEIFGRIKDKWPEIKHFGAHLHNSRGMALPSMYAAISSLGPDDTLKLEGTIGGLGGCPYCGNGRYRRRHAHDGGNGHRDRCGPGQTRRLCLDVGGDCRTQFVGTRLQSRRPADEEGEVLRHQCSVCGDDRAGHALQAGS